MSKQTKQLMAQRKHKTVSVNGIIYNSIAEACTSLNICRKTFDRIRKNQHSIKLDIVYM